MSKSGANKIMLLAHEKFEHHLVFHVLVEYDLFNMQHFFGYLSSLLMFPYNDFFFHPAISKLQNFNSFASLKRTVQILSCMAWKIVGKLRLLVVFLQFRLTLTYKVLIFFFPQVFVYTMIEVLVNKLNPHWSNFSP